jgi:nucleotide-binding universal stress UspA family protein
VRRKARVALVAFIVAMPLLHLAAVAAFDAWTRVRDPEYGRRLAALRARTVEHRSRPLALAFGSSRVAMGVRPGAWEDARPKAPADPLLFNMATVGGGPIQQLLAVRRAYADGAKPAVVLLEYWPPLLRQDGEFAEAARIDARRLGSADRPTVRDFFPAVEGRMTAARLNPFAAHGPRLLAQLDPELLPKPGRPSVGWADLDRWGWLPGMDPHPDDAATRRTLTEHQRTHFAKQLDGAAIHPDSDRALREAVALARGRGAKVGFVFLPETGEFRRRYPPDLERSAREHLARLSAELAVPVIDARDWMDERLLADGFHLSRVGAAAFTARLGAAVAATFPHPGGAP